MFFNWAYARWWLLENWWWGVKLACEGKFNIVYNLWPGYHTKRASGIQTHTTVIKVFSNL